MTKKCLKNKHKQKRSNEKFHYANNKKQIQCIQTSAEIYKKKTA